VHINDGVTGYISHGNYNIDSDQTSPLIGPLVQTEVTAGVSYADLEVDLDDGLAAIGWGQSVQLTLTVINNGPSNITGGTVTYTVPAELTGVTWTCVGSGTATCSATGSDSISDSVDIPSGDSVVYTISATVIAGTGTDSMSNQASAAPQGGVTDNFPDNDYDVDSTDIGTPVTLTVTKNTTGGGTISSAPAAISCDTACSSDAADFLDGATVTINAVAATNFSFTGWSGGTCAGTDPCTLTLSGSTTVNADFDCLAGYYGATCATQCPGSGNCSGNGTCDDGLSGAGACTCDPGYVGADCSTYNPDTDGDGVLDSTDNCPLVSNSSQTDTDSDGDGDACDSDDDDDTVADGSDNCPLVSNSSQTDTDSDGDGDACDSDDDDDTVADGSDNCPLVANTNQTDTDSDGDGDACDSDDDDDTVADGSDNCPLVANTNQTDTDSDGAGNACDSDDDGDGIPDSTETSNDKDSDGIPNQLDLDSDDDGIPDSVEGTEDEDGDGTPNYLDRDADGDCILDIIEKVTEDGFAPASGTDSDQNGIDNAFGPDGKLDPIDSDNDTDPDYLDIDSDGDGTNDFTEAYDTDNDGEADYTPTGTDSDGDGWDDGMNQFTTPSNLPGYWRDASNGVNSCVTVSHRRKLKNAKAAAEVLLKRTIHFSLKAQGCSGEWMGILRTRAATHLSAINRILDRRIGTNTLSCPAYVCQKSSTSSLKSRLNARLASLHRQSLMAKLSAMNACPASTPHPEPEPGATPVHHKRSIDYLNDALAAVSELPKKLTSCD
jgi:uncharacterized repeat protein (TIGR01451 family)